MSITSINAVDHSDSQNPTTFKLIPLDQLRLHPDNVRQGDKTSDQLAAMKASIQSHGIIHPLDCTLLSETAAFPLYGVVAGGMRYRALLALQQTHELPSSLRAGIPCTLCPEGANYAEISMAENEIRAGMIVADQIAAWSKLSKSGLSADDIATRFGVTTNIVARRLKLTDLIPEIIDLHTEGAINYETLTSFTLAPSAAAQRSYIEANEQNTLSAWSVRRHFQQGTYDGDSGIITFIGQDAYFAAGGTVAEDLFSSNDSDLRFTDAQIVHDLAMSKLNAKKEELLANGWKWVKTALKSGDHDYANTVYVYEEENEPTDAEQARIDALSDILDQDDQDTYSKAEFKAFEEEIEQIEDQVKSRDHWLAEQKACSGIFLSVSYTGTFAYDYRCKDEDVLKDDDNDNILNGLAQDTDSQFSAALKDDMNLLRTNIVQHHILKHPDIYYDILAYNISCSLYGLHSNSNSISPNGVHLAGSDSGQPFAKDIGDFGELLDKSWHKHPTDAARFAAFTQLSHEAKEDWLKYAVALSSFTRLEHGRGDIDDSSNLVAQSLDIDWCNIWRPAAEFWKRLRKPMLRAVLTPILGEGWVNIHIDTKKAVLAAQLEDIFAGRSATLDQTQQANALNWQVPGLGHDPELQDLPCATKPAIKQVDPEPKAIDKSQSKFTVQKANIIPTRQPDGSVQWIAEKTADDETPTASPTNIAEAAPASDHQSNNLTAVSVDLETDNKSNDDVSAASKVPDCRMMVFDSHLNPITPGPQAEAPLETKTPDQELPAFLQ